MMSFGIESGQLPISNHGTIKTQNQKKWIAYRKMRDRLIEEGEEDSMVATFCPSTNDVLAIGGTHFYKFMGNIRYRDILESNLHHYDNASSVHEKIYITNKVLRTIEERGGRFLAKDNNGWWTPTDKEAARMKISNAFRDLRKSMRARENRKRMNSDTHKFSETRATKFTSCI